jgi:hypothetical protein
MEKIMNRDTFGFLEGNAFLLSSEPRPDRFDDESTFESHRYAGL